MNKLKIWMLAALVIVAGCGKEAPTTTGTEAQAKTAIVATIRLVFIVEIPWAPVSQGPAIRPTAKLEMRNAQAQRRAASWSKVAVPIP